MKKLLLTLLLFGLTFSSFSYGVDSYTCSYNTVLNGVFQYSNTDYLNANSCNDFGGIYDCQGSANIGNTSDNCYKFNVDLYNYTNVEITIDNGSSYDRFSYMDGNLTDLENYVLCSPRSLYINFRGQSPVNGFVVSYKYIPVSSLYSYSYTYTCPTCQECQECQECPSCPSINTGEILSGYILESEITTGYCETRFNMIQPSDCPNSSGSGDVMWSSFRVNNFQVMGGRNIYLYIPEWLDWSYTYVDENLQVDVENQGDEEYIQSVIDINSYRPTSEDFTSAFVSGLTLIMPYIVIVLFIIFIRKFIKKIFK